MTMDDAERRARELLAEAYREEVPTSEVAKVIEEGFDGVISSRFAIRALTKLLRATPPAVGAPEVEQAAARMMHGPVGRRLTREFTDEEIRYLASMALLAPQPREEEA